MKNLKISKETAIKSILSDLKKGIDKKIILQTLSDNYKNSTKSFYNYYDAALTEYHKFLSIANPIIQAKEIEALGNLAKEGILTRFERQKILSDIARGDKRIWKESVSRDGIVTLDCYDPIRAIAELNKMDGSYLNEIETAESAKITSIKITSI